MSVKVSATLLLIDCILVAYTGDFYFRCNGLYGQVSFDSRDDQKATAKYKEAIKGILPENLLIVDVRCCFFNDDFGFVFSSRVIETDYFWQCTHIPLGQQSRNYMVDGYDNSKWENAQVIRNFFEDPTADIVYDESKNNGLEKFFDTNAKWIWATVNGSAPVYDRDHRFCVSCKGHTKNYVPREFFGWLSSASKEGFQLFGINYREFELVFELLPPSWNSSYCTGSRVTMTISSGHSYLIAIFGAETDLVSQLWQCTSDETDMKCIRLAEVSMYPLKCHMFNQVWIAINHNGHFSLGVGRILHRNVGVLVKLKSEYQTIKELRIDYASTQKQKNGNHLAKLRIFRSIKDNRCIFRKDELSLLQPCGDGYIMDERLCHECGCCFYPAHLLGRHVTKDYSVCYRPMSSLQHSDHNKASMPSCFRSFHDVIKNVSFAVRPSGKIKLFQNVTFVIAIQSMPTNVRVKLNFGDGLTEENVTLAKNAKAPDQMSVAYRHFYFGTVVHQYTSQAPSSLHDCLQKSCTGYFARLEVVGRGEDRLEVVQFVEGGDAPFKAQIFTRAESKNGNVTICAVVSKLEVPISLVQASMEFDGSTVNVSLKENLNVSAWLSNHSEPGDYAVLLNHVFTTKDLAVIKLHLVLPNGVHYTVETQLAKLFQDPISLYDVMTDTGKRSSFNLYENITFLLRIQLASDVTAALSFGDGKLLQNVKLSRSIPLKDVPEWAVPFTRNSSLCKTFVSHRYTNPGKYLVRLEFSDVPNSDDALFNETEVHVRSFVESLGKVVLITNSSVTINPYDAVTFIILVENIVSNMMAVLKLDEDSASLYARFSRSTKVEYEGVWYNAVTVTYSFYKPGRHNITLTIKDGYNSSNQAPSVATTEIMVNGIQDAIGEVGLYVDPSKLNLVNTDVEFCLLVQRHFRHMRLHASMGDGHTVDFIQVNQRQQPPLWMKLVPPKSFYLKGVFSHVYSYAGTYLVEVIAEDSLKSRPDYSTALIRVVVEDPLSDTVTVRAESDAVSVGTTENLGDGRSHSRQTDESQFSVSDFTDPSATVLSSFHALMTVETSESIGLSRDTTELVETRDSIDLSRDTTELVETSDSIDLSRDTTELVETSDSIDLSRDTTELAETSDSIDLSRDTTELVETSDSMGLSRDTTEFGDGLATEHQQSTETDADAMSHSRGSSPIDGFPTAGSNEQYTTEIADTVEQTDSDSDSSGMDFDGSSMHQLDGSTWKRTDTNEEYRSNFADLTVASNFADLTVASNFADLTVASSDQQYYVKGTDASQQSNLDGKFSNVVTRKSEHETLNGSNVGERNAFTASGIDKGNDASIEGCSDSELLGLDCTIANTNQQGDLKEGSDTVDEHEFKSDFLDKESSTASIGPHYTAQGTEDRRFVTVDDYGSTSLDIQFPQNEIDTDETSGLSTNISAVHSNTATNVSQQYPIKEIITDENAGFPSTSPESGIDRFDPDKTTVTSQPNVTMATDVGEDYDSTVTGDALGTFVSGTDLYKTTMDQTNILLPTNGGVNGESQTSTNESDTLVARYTIIVYGQNEDTVVHTSEDLSQTLKFSAAETAISKAEEKAETTLEDNDYSIETTKLEKVFSEETAEVLPATSSFIDDRNASEDLPNDEKRTQEIVPGNKQDFNVTTNGELDAAEATSAYLSSTTDDTPPDSKRTRELPGENLVNETSEVGDLDTLEVTLGDTAKDRNSAFSTESYTQKTGEQKFTENVRRPDDSKANSVIATVDPETSNESNALQSTERFSIIESSTIKDKDDEEMYPTNSMERQDTERLTVAELTLNVTPDKETATETYKSVANDKISQVATTVVKNVSDELNFDSKRSTGEISYQSLKGENFNGLNSLSPGSETETGLSEGEALSAAAIGIKSNVPDKGITPSEISTNELKQVTSGLSKDTYSAETDRRDPGITVFKSISHELDTKFSTATPNTLSTDITKLNSRFISIKGTEIPTIHETSQNIWTLKSATSGSGEEMLVGDTSRKPFETTLKDTDHKNISSPHVHNFHVTVYVDPAGIVNFLVLLENVTKNLRGEILFGDNRGENITFHRLTSDFPDWLLEMPAKDGNFQQAVRTHVYPDSNSTYEARVTVYDNFGNGFWKTVIFKPQYCAENESILKVNDKTSKTCFQFSTKDSIYLNIRLPFCLLMRSTKSRWNVSRILKQGNDTKYLAKDILSSPIAYDVVNYTILPFTLEAASYMIEAHVNSEDEFGTIVGLSKASACISLEPTRLQAAAFASKQHYTINETIKIDATSTRDPSEPLSNSGLELLWFCSSKNITKDTNRGESKSSACFEDDQAVLAFSGTILTFPATQLIFTFLPANYFLTVMVRKSGRESASTTVQISLIAGDQPSLNLSCLYNCKANIDVDQLLALEVSCSNCHRTEQLSYLWRFVSSKPSNKLASVSSREVLMEYNTARCAVKAGIFSMASFFEEYKIEVRVSREDGTYSWTSYPVQITTLRGEELSSLNLNSSFGYMKREQDHMESRDLGPLIGIIIGVVAGLIALAGTIYLVRRHLSRKARASSKKATEGGSEPPKQSTEANTGADASA